MKRSTKTKTRWYATALLLAVATFIVLTLPVLANDSPPASNRNLNSNQTKSSGEVRRERDNTEKELAGSQVRLDNNDRQISNQLDRLNDIESQITRQEVTIDEINMTIEEMTLQSAILADSIRALQFEDSLLCIQVAKGLRERHVQSQRMPALAFISSSKSLREAQSRLNYLNVIQRAKNDRIKQLRNKRKELETAKSQLDALMKKRASAVKQLSTAKDILKTRQNEVRVLVDDLRDQGSVIEKIISAKKEYLDKLNISLNRILFNEQREQSPAFQTDNSPTTSSANIPQLKGTFESNKGKLLFPVPGRYSIVGTFGRSRHSELSHVQLDNSGIDISVNPGTRARAVFDGVVTSIVFMENYDNIIIVRHGKYLTVYAGLGTISVKKGDKVRTGQDLGKIANVAGKNVLHFEVRNERDKLNPLLWVR